MKKLTLLFTLMFSSMTYAWIIDGVGDYKFEALNSQTYVMHGPLGEPSVQNYGFMNNPGIIIGKQGVIVIDPGSTLQVGNKVLEEIEKISKKPIVAVFNTHVHGDHWLGNQAIVAKYPNVKIYAHPKMIAHAKDGESDLWLGIMNTLTDNDIMIEHVGSKTLFLGDNDLMKRFGRFDGSSSMHGNIAALKYATDLNLGHYVPGHGPSGDADAAVKPFLDYLIVIQEESKKGYEEDLADYEIKPFAHKRLADYHHWNGYEEQLGKHINKMLLEIESLDI